MNIGLRIRQLREQKDLSQGDVEERTGMLRCYVSRIENGHTIPSLENLERFAEALDVPLHRLFYPAEDTPSTPNLTPRATLEQLARDEGKDDATERFLLKLKTYTSKIAEADREVLLTMARRLAPR